MATRGQPYPSTAKHSFVRKVVHELAALSQVVTSLNWILSFSYGKHLFLSETRIIQRIYFTLSPEYVHECVRADSVLQKKRILYMAFRYHKRPCEQLVDRTMKHSSCYLMLSLTVFVHVFPLVCSLSQQRFSECSVWANICARDCENDGDEVDAVPDLLELIVGKHMRVTVISKHVNITGKLQVHMVTYSKGLLVS